MTKAKCSLICTVLNEENSITKFLQSVAEQVMLPSEIIIVDGGSSDNTVNKIKEVSSQYKNLNIKIFIKTGNRSVGRNEAIKKSKFDIVLITDSGCELHKDWVKKMYSSFSSNVDVVAGYYKGKYTNIFQKSLIPYVLVMPNKVDPNNFLPATRSMALRKKVWSSVGGFNVKYSHNEDYVFANKIKEKGFNIKFNKKAIVYWEPRSNIKSTFRMFYRFAYGDVESGIFREKVFWLIFRYLVGFYLLTMVPIMKSLYLNIFIVGGAIGYLFWTIFKNYNYVKNIKGLIFLPLIQFTADVAVLAGTIKAFLVNIKINLLIKRLIRQRMLLIILFIYIGACLVQINWGIPGNSHPFNYFMDEWHQSQSVRNLFRFGSPNIEGSANGSIFHFFLTGIYLIPFIATKIVNPFLIKSSVLNMDIQQVLFIVLRLNTILFGVLSITVFYYLSKKFLKINPSISTIFFSFNPMWLMLSGYFKYDIALMFWTLLSILFMFKYLKEFKYYNFYFACLLSALALSVKLSPFALIPILGLVFIFNKDWRKRLFILVKGGLIYLSTFLSFGIIDIILAKGSLNEYLSSTLSRTPEFNAANFQIVNKIWPYLLLDLFPTLFSHVFYIVGILGAIIFIFIFLGNLFISSKKFKYLFDNRILISFFAIFILFACSLIPLKLDATNNRVLIMIPFLAYFVSYFIKFLSNRFNNLLIVIFTIFILVLQLMESFSWLPVKLFNDPRQSSAIWINKNVPANSTIGIQNIPIYQGLPDLVVKEFYNNQYQVGSNNKFKYKIVQASDKTYPKYVILTNVDIETKYKHNSETKDIYKNLQGNKYKLIKKFSPNFKYLFLFTNDLNYYMAAIVQSPVEISIYKNDK